MLILYILFQLALPLIVIAGIVWAVIAWRCRERRRIGAQPEQDRGIGAWRRAYFYGACFISLLIAGNGLVQIGRYLLDELFGPQLLQRDAGPLAIGAVLTVIWTPVWAWHWCRLAWHVQHEPEERGFLLRRLYFYLMLGVTAGLAISGGVETLRWLLDARSFSGYSLSALAFWTGVWLYHWRLENSEGWLTPLGATVRRIYVYLASLTGLVMLAVSLAVAMALLFREFYEQVTDLPFLLQYRTQLWDGPMKSAIAVALVGIVVWAWHWLHVARLDQTSILRQFYLYTLAILGGAITSLVASGVIINGSLVWAFGVPDQGTAAGHFRFLPDALAVLTVGALLWGYHGSVVYFERGTATALAIARRTYGYIMTAIGIGTLAGAIIIYVPTVIGLLINESISVLAGDDWWRNQTAAASTLGILGIPVWGYHWMSREREASRAVEERDSLPRRVLLFATILIGAVAALGSLSHLLYLVLDALLENDVSLTLLRSGKWSMGIFTAALFFGPYYWLVLREDRKVLGERAKAQLPVVKKQVTILIGDDSDGFIDGLETILGHKVQVQHFIDTHQRVVPVTSLEALQLLADRIRRAPSERVLVVSGADGQFEVLAYR